MKKLWLAAAAVCVLGMTACGGSVGALIIPEAGIGLFEPDLVYSHESTAIRLLGVNFGARAKPVTIRFTADAGTPFAGGTATTHEFEGTVDSEQQIRASLPPTFFAAAFQAYITIVLADGREASTTDPIANFMPQEVLSITPSTASSGALIEFTVTGNGFQPPDGLVGVRFEAESGTPFAGGASSLALTNGTVATPTTIVGNFPDVIAASPTNAFVTVLLDSGEIRSSTPIITFFPSPAVVNFTPAVTSGGLTPPFTVQGTAFAPVGGTATITLHAMSGTPFSGGTSATHSFTGMITSNSTIQGTMTDTGVNATTFAQVEVDLPTGGNAISALTLVQIFPGPTFDSVAPTTIESGEMSYNLTITGTNFSPGGGTVNLTFTAAAGTPFLNGTAATMMVNGIITSTTTIGLALPNPDVDASTTATISGVFPSGAVATSSAGILTIDPEPPFTVPAWDSSFGTLIGLGDDSSDNQSFSSVSFPFYGTAYSDVWICSNGFLTFGGSCTTFSETVGGTPCTLPSIMPLWDDFNPNTSNGAVYFKELADRVVVTYDRIDQFGGGTDENSFQVHMYTTGRIDIVYLTTAATDGNTGIHAAGTGTGVAAAQTFSNTVHPARTSVGVNYPYQGGGHIALNNGWIVFEPLGPSFDGTDGYQYATGP